MEQAQEQKVTSLGELVEEQRWEEVDTRLDQEHVQDIARELSGLEPELVLQALDRLPEDRHAEVFSYLPPTEQYPLLHEADNNIGRRLMQSLHSDDRTALLESLDSDEAEELLRLLSPSEVKQALEMLGYPENSAGRLMNTQFVSVRPNWSLARALEHVRAESEHGDGVNTIYITDYRGRLLGTISLKRLVLEPPSGQVAALISGPPVSIEAGDERTEAARAIQHYDITALPVVDRHGIMLGVVTVDDVMDVVEEEATEDFHRIGGMGAAITSFSEASLATLYQKRIGWLVMLVFVNILSGLGIAYFEATIEAVIALVFFMPLIIASGGNAGSQSATLMVRALATGDVLAADWLKLWGKELGVSVALGITMGVAVYGIGLWRGGTEIALIVASAMVLVVAFGSMIGMILPLLLNRFNFDPATASTPLITSIADICGILIYFSIATAILTLPPPG